MEGVISKLFYKHEFDHNLISLIRQFTGDKTSDVDIYVKRILATSTGHENLFGCVFRFQLGHDNLKVVSKYSSDYVMLELRGRKYAKLQCRMKCRSQDVTDFDSWVEKTNSYFDMCEHFLYFIIHQFKGGLLQCNVCNKFHFTETIDTCTSCLKIYNQTCCGVCKSFFGKMPHSH